MKDAWNWWEACNHISYGTDWKKRVPQKIWEEIHGKTFREACDFLLPYLRRYYKEHDKELRLISKEVQSLFTQYGQEACILMEDVTKHPLYRKSFTCFLTTFPRCPYSFQKGYVWLCASWPAKCYLGTFLHELLHFQFFAYYQNRKTVKKLSLEQKEILKESLTVILNNEFLPYLCQKDKGYIPHQALRKQLSKFWSQNKNLDALIDFGVRLLTKK